MLRTTLQFPNGSLRLVFFLHLFIKISICNMCPKMLNLGGNGLNSKLKHRICSKRAFYLGELVTCMGDLKPGATDAGP